MKTLIMSLVMGFASVLAVVATPALPEMAKELGYAREQIVLVVSLYLAGYGLGNLLYGPFSNRYGRRRALDLAVIIALFGAVLSALVSNQELYWLLLLGRFITAVGATGGTIVVLTMVGDTLSGAAAAKKLALILLGFSLIPSIAVTFGGYLTGHFGWRSCFYFSVAYPIFLWLIALRLPETLDRTIELPPMGELYWRKLRSPRVILGSLLRALAGCWIYLFAAEAPFIGINMIGLSPETYGLLSLIPPIGSLAGAFASHRLADKKPPLAVLKLAIVIGLIGAIAMTLCFSFGFINIWTLFLPAPLFFMSSSMLSSNSSALVLEGMKDRGTTAAVLNCIGMFGTVAILSIVSALPSHLPYLFPLVLIVVSGGGLWVRRALLSVTKK